MTVDGGSRRWGTAGSFKGRRILVTGGSGFIGTNLMEELDARGAQLLNVSRTYPRNAAQARLFARVHILDPGSLRDAFTEFSPEIVVHLAAKTGYGNKVNREAYEINTTGTAHVIRAASSCATVSRVIVASSFVVGTAPGEPDENDSRPRYRYADSKGAAEKLVTQESLPRAAWCIVRPCSVWGPWFGAPFRDFFLSIARGRYVHPGDKPVRKCMGYVGNIVHQLCRLLGADAGAIHRKVFYLGDYEQVSVQAWANMISAELGVRRPVTAPAFILSAAAACGDILSALGFSGVSLTTHRLSNMRTEAPVVPLGPICAIAGPLPFTMKEGIRSTVAWMRREGLLVS